MTTYLIKPIQAVDLRQNESDGAILMELNGTINADVINADMNAISGTPPNNATLYDLKGLLATIDADTSKIPELGTAVMSASTPVTQASDDPFVVAIGTTTDTPLAGETPEGATARSGISLWKRAVNKLIDIKALLVKGTAVMISSLAVTIATDDTQFGAVGAAADPDGNIHGQLRSIAESVAKLATANNPGDGIPVGNTSTTVLAANASRLEASLVNDSDETIYARLGTSAVMNSGIRLNANGGSYATTKYTGIITAICASGSKNLCVSEV